LIEVAKMDIVPGVRTAIKYAMLRRENRLKF
jgi:hypothetical protein